MGTRTVETRRQPDTPVGSLKEAFAHLPATLRGRCPECGQDKVFKNFFQLKETCSTCGVRYERDPGSYMVSMVLNYFFSILLTAGMALAAILRYGFFPGVTFVFIVVVCLTVLVMHRPSKVIYLWLMWTFGFVYPDPVSRDSARAEVGTTGGGAVKRTGA